MATSRFYVVVKLPFENCYDVEKVHDKIIATLCEHEYHFEVKKRYSDYTFTIKVKNDVEEVKKLLIILDSVKDVVYFRAKYYSYSTIDEYFSKGV